MLSEVLLLYIKKSDCQFKFRKEYSFVIFFKIPYQNEFNKSGYMFMFNIIYMFNIEYMFNIILTLLKSWFKESKHRHCP